MAPQALVNAFVYCDDHDFTGDSNQSMLQCDGVPLEGTNFRSAGWREYPKLGLKTTQYDVQGFWQSAAADSVDSDSFPDLAVVNRVFTVADVETAGQPAYLFQAGKSKYQLFGQLGALAPFSLHSAGTDPFGVVRGLLGAARQSVSATGALGSGLNLGAVSATQFVYASFHVFPVVGTTITVVVESAAASNFAGATTRATIGPLTTVGGVWLPRVAGAISDTWWRFRVTAITGTFTVAGAIAVQ